MEQCEASTVCGRHAGKTCRQFSSCRLTRKIEKVPSLSSGQGNLGDKDVLQLQSINYRFCVQEFLLLLTTSSNLATDHYRVCVHLWLLNSTDPETLIPWKWLLELLVDRKLQPRLLWWALPAQLFSSHSFVCYPVFLILLNYSSPSLSFNSGWYLHYAVKSNQMFHYTRYISPKHVTSLRGYLRVIAPRQHSSFRRNVTAVASRWLHYVWFDLPMLAPQTFRSRDEHVTARPTGRFALCSIVCNCKTTSYISWRSAILFLVFEHF